MEEKEYYEDGVYKDESEKNPKKILIIGGIVVGIIIIILLFFIFGSGKSKKPVDSNNNLKNIFIEGGEIEPDFNKDILEYDLKTTSSSIRISCAKESDNSTVKGCDLGEIMTADLTDDIVITVIAANKTEKQYVLRVNSGYEGITVNVSGNESEWSNKEVTLKVSAEGDNPLANEPYSFDNGVTWQAEDTKTFDSNTSIKIRVKDNQDNISVAKNVDIKIDKTVPKVEVTGSVPSEQLTDTAVTLTSNVTPKETPSGYKYQWYNGNTPIEGAVETNYVTSDSGNYTVEVITGAGNKVRSNNYIVANKNSVKPTITGIDGIPSGWSDGDVTITVKVNSPNGVHENGYSFDGGKTWQSSASKTITSMSTLSVVVKDKNLNVSDVKTVKVKIDKVKPSVKITGSVVSGKATTNNVKLTAVATPSSAPSGYKYQWYKDSQVIKGATKSTYTATVSGKYMVRVTTGVNKTATSSGYTVNKQANNGTKPTSTVSITKVSGNPTSWTSGNVTLSVTAKASSGLHSKAYSFDNGKTWQSSSSKTFKSNQTVYIRVRDKNGKISAENVQTINKIDKTGPVVSFSPDGNSTADNSVVTKVTVTDKNVGKLGTLYFALSISSTTQPKFTSTFKSGQSIKIANGTGVYYLWIKATDSLGNTTVTKSKSFKISNTVPDVQISAYKADANGNKVGSALKTVKNGNVQYTGWKNYGIVYDVSASTTVGSIKSVTWQWSSTRKKTYAEANTANSWNGGGKSNYDRSNITVSLTGDGVRLGKITVMDAAGNSRTVNVRIDIDKSAPTINFKISGTTISGGYRSGAVVTATCSDALSGVTYMYTYDAQDKSDYRTYNSSAVSSKSHAITLVTADSIRYITTTCKDALGNTKNKNSSSYKISY